MINRENCFFCGLKSNSLPYRHKAEVGISCKRCGDYYIDDLLVECKDSSIKELDKVLSGYTRWEKEKGNLPPEIHAQNIDEITNLYKSLSVEVKVDKILLYYSKKSPERGKYITYDIKMDYPIGFSKVIDEFRYLLKEEAWKTFGFLDIKATDTLTITPEGWRRVGRLERMILADKKIIIEQDKIKDKLKHKEAEKKEQAGLKYSRYSDGLARQLGDLNLSISFEILNIKLEIDKKIILKVRYVSEPEDINFLINRIIDFAEIEKEAFKDNVRRVYHECHRDSLFQDDLERYMKKFNSNVEEIEVDLLSGKKKRKGGLILEKNEKDKLLESNANPKKVFVVHGRNEKARQAMFEFLRSIDIQPIEWGEAVKATQKASSYIGEILSTAFSIAQAIIVLFTGDELVKLRDEYIQDDDPSYEKILTPQARTNVIFEAGLAFGTHPNRTILVMLAKEKTKPFSDIYGRHFVRLDNAPKARYELISRLRTAKCQVDVEFKQDWISAGDFDGAVLDYVEAEETE